MKPKTLFHFEFKSYDNESLQAKVFNFKANAVYLHEYRPWWLFWMKRKLFIAKPDTECFQYREMISEWELAKKDTPKRIEYMKRHMFQNVAVEMFEKFF